MKRIWAMLLTAVLLAACCRAEGGLEMYNRDLLEQTSPYVYSVQLAEEKGLASEGAFTDEYFALQAWYMKAFFEYVDSKIEIRRLDREIGENPLGYEPCGEPENVYQQVASFGMQFFYLRNGFYIERLNADEIDMLRNIVQNDTSPASDEAKAFILLTEERVLTIDTEEPEEMNILMEPYGYTAKNLGLILGVSFKRTIGPNLTEEQKKGARERADFMDYAAKQLEEKLTLPLDLNVTVLVY